LPARCSLIHGFRMLTVLVAVNAGLVSPVPAATHPGQHLDLRISINDEEVLYEIILSTDLSNAIFLNDHTDFIADRKQARYHFVDPERAALTRAAFDRFFKEKNAVKIDGVLVKPILRTLEFVPNPVLAGDQDPYSFPPDARVVLVYTTKGRPKQVAMVWDLYPQDATRAAFGLDPTVEVVAELDAYDENKIILFSVEEPEVIWHAPGKPARQRISPVVVAHEPATMPVPLLSLGIAVGGLVALLILGLAHAARRRWRAVLAVASVVLVIALLTRDVLVLRVPAPGEQSVRLPDAREARDLFAALHRNVYRAFDYKSESDVYDVLAQSVDGELLDQVYNEVYQSLILRDQGGAVARVKAVDILGTEIESAGVVSESGAAAFQVRSRWQVRGAVYHWGHVHSRTNEYKARYTVAQRGSNWKITGVEVLEQRRIVKEGDDPALPPRTRPGDEF
jgi:hypothetical protein